MLIGSSLGVGISGSATLSTSILWSAAFNTGYITQFDTAWFHPATVHTHTVLMSYSAGTGVRARIRYKTVGADPTVDANWTTIPSSVVTLSGTPDTMLEVESAAIPYSEFGSAGTTRDYRCEVQKMSGSETPCVIYRSRIAHKVG